MFTQDDPTAPTAEDTVQDATEPSVPTERRDVDPLGNRLKFSTSWADEPVIDRQAQIYPDTVKVVSERYRVFDMSSEIDMEEYSKLRLSSAMKGRYYITSDELQQWSDAKGTWLVAFRVQERMFKTHLTSTQDPSEP